MNGTALGQVQPHNRRDAFRQDFIAFHGGFQTELGICVPREYWLTIGVRKY